MRYREIVSESARPGVLYHGTYVDDAVSILDRDYIQGRTPHRERSVVGVRPKDVDGFGSVYGVSLTRDVRFARKWRSGGGVVLVLDEAILRQRYKLYPVKYYNDRDESEEFLRGSIQPLSRVLVGISMSQETASELAGADDVYGYATLLEHPLLRVEGQKWDAVTGRNIAGGND